MLDYALGAAATKAGKFECQASHLFADNCHMPDVRQMVIPGRGDRARVLLLSFGEFLTGLISTSLIQGEDLLLLDAFHIAEQAFAGIFKTGGVLQRGGLDFQSVTDSEKATLVPTFPLGNVFFFSLRLF